MKKLPLILCLLRAAAGILFIYSGYSKLMDPSSRFMEAIMAYQLVNLQTASVLAAVLPWVELFSGAFFVLGLWLQPSLYVLWGISAIFFTAISSALLRGIPIQDCGCFGEKVHALPIQATLGIDAVLLVIFYWMHCVRKEIKKSSLDRFLE